MLASRRSISLFVIVGLGGCTGESVLTLPNGSSLEPPSAAVSGQNISASGHTNIIFQGVLQTFSFHARQHHDGSVSGSFQINVHGLEIKLHGSLDCLIVDGVEAVMSGIVTKSSSEFFPVGSGVIFRVADLGEGGGGSPDLWSDLFVFPGTPFETCDVGFALPLIPNDAGNIRVKPSGF